MTHMANTKTLHKNLKDMIHQYCNYFELFRDLDNNKINQPSMMANIFDVLYLNL